MERVLLPGAQEYRSQLKMFKLFNHCVPFKTLKGEISRRLKAQKVFNASRPWGDRALHDDLRAGPSNAKQHRSRLNRRNERVPPGLIHRASQFVNADALANIKTHLIS